jgi:hypothetical protein
MQRRPVPKFLATALVAALTLSAAAQDPVAAPPPPDEQDPQIAAKIELLADAWSERRQTRDAEALRCIEELSTRLDQPVHPKDRSAILSTFAKVLTQGRLRGPEAATPYEAVARGLAKLGEDGAEVLIRAYERKRFPRHTEWAPMRERLIEAVGASGAPAAIPFLLERAQRSGEASELRAAGAAMGRFDEAPQPQRKEMVETLARRLAGFESEASAPAVNQDQQLNLNRENAIRTLQAVSGPWQSALHQLTGESMESGAAWQKWFQDNKRRDWDRGGDGG